MTNQPQFMADGVTFPNQVNSAGAFKWAAIFGALSGVAWVLAMSFYESGSYSYYGRRDETIFEVFALVALGLTLASSVFVAVALYRAFRTFDAMGKVMLFGQYPMGYYTQFSASPQQGSSEDAVRDVEGGEGEGGGYPYPYTNQQ